MGLHSVLHSHGEAEWTDKESGRKTVRDCLQCCHCALQFFVEPESGKKRGYCMNCGAVTCGQPKCDPCIHWKRKIELIESGRADMSLISTGKAEGLPISVATTIACPGSKKLILPNK